MTRYRLDLAYDGAGFHGWAGQGSDLRTVQGELESWLQRILRLPERAELTCAGRTDAGVHARGQVAHVDLPDALGPADQLAAELTRRLGRVLPPDVVVRRVAPAPPGFDARFAALWRRYVYRLSDAPVDPLLRGWVAHVPGPVDAAALDAAGARLLGLHDFGGFCRRREGASTIRTLLECRAARAPEGTLAVTVRADAFCHSMVRSLVGALLAVAQGRRPAAWLDTLLDRPDRAGEVTVMPPHGLVLEEVGYPPAEELSARVAVARARRDEPAPASTQEEP